MPSNINQMKNDKLINYRSEKSTNRWVLYWQTHPHTSTAGASVFKGGGGN